MKTLFDQTKLASIPLKNRFVRSATWENMADEQGHLTEKLYQIHEELAKNEVGLLITGYANVVKEEAPNPGMIGIYDDSFIPEYKKLTDLVHQYNSRIILQVAYGGTKTTYQVENRTIFAPSMVPERSTKTLGKEMTKEDIAYIVTAFKEAARRAKESGFDGIEIHGAHSYLINQFLSPYYNQRTDEYGGCLENRMRFMLEIYHAMRQAVGADYPILIKLTACDFFDGGLTFEDTKVICKTLEAEGIDGIEISGNIHGSASKQVGESFCGHTIQSQGYFLEYADEISKLVTVPVITVGGFNQYEAMEQILNDTNISYFALSRPLLAEPDLIKRWYEGNHAKAKCVRCSKCRTTEGNYCVIFSKR